MARATTKTCPALLEFLKKNHLYPGTLIIVDTQYKKRPEADVHKVWQDDKKAIIRTEIIQDVASCVKDRVDASQ
jgi:hypothetical protein